MSGSNEQRENIQRLAKGVKIKGPLGPVGTREPIRGKVTPFNENTFAPPSTAPAGYTEPACTPEGEDPDDTEKQEEIDPEDPNTFVRGTLDPDEQDGQKTQQGTQDIGSAINDDTGLTLGSGGANRELTGLKDCDTGKEFNLHLDGNFVPPEGWDDPDTPPLADGYEDWDENFYWITNPGGLGAAEGATAQIAYNIAEASLIANPDVESYTLQRGLEQQTATQWNWRWSAFIDSVGTGVVTTTVFRQGCVSVGNPSTSCIAEIPSAESWPEDGSYDVAIKDGQFQTNEFDADAPENFEPSGTKDFCYGDGSNGRAHVTADGGVMYYGTNEEGAPTGTARVLDSSGQLVAAGDATDSFITQYLPQ